jgi:uncharacterized protein
MTADPRDANARLEVVDALRGYALFGLLMVHMVERFELYWLDPQPDPWFDGVFAIFAGKSFAIFALLFGFSFATIMANQRRRGTDFAARFAWRLALLLIIGTAHALLYRGDILQVLAIMGLVLMPLERVRSPSALAIAAALFFVQIPLLAHAYLAAEGVAAVQAQPRFFGDSGLSTLADGSLAEVVAINATAGMAAKWSFYVSTGRLSQIAGLFVVGMLLQRSGAFEGLDAKRKGWAIATAAAVAAWLAVDRSAPMLVPATPEEGGAPMAAQAIVWAIDSWRAIALSAFQIGVFLLLWQARARRALAWFALPGRMTLTLYVAQSCVVVPLLYGFGTGLWDDLSSAQLVLGGHVFFAAQIGFAAWWYRGFRYGPLEWLWRAATLTDWRVPFRRTAPGPNAG